MNEDGERTPISLMLTMRTFGNTMKELTVCHQLALDDKMEKFVDIFMDESYIVMVIKSMQLKKQQIMLIP